MSLASLAAEVHEQQKWQQFTETWGHLYPKPGDHQGTMVVARSDYNAQGVTIVHESFEGVENSPWFYEAMNDFVFKSMTKKRTRYVERTGIVMEWSIFDGESILFSDSRKKTFSRQYEAEEHLRLVRTRLADSTSLSRIQYERAEVREVQREIQYQDVEHKSVRSAGIWEFSGALRVYQNGKLRFIGKWMKMDLYPGRIPATRPRQRQISLSAAYQGKLKHEPYKVGDTNYLDNNAGACVRFLDTMNQRRSKKNTQT